MQNIKNINSNYVELRKKFFDFFADKGHQVINSAPLIQKKDPSLFFTNAGMNQFKIYFTMEKLAPYSRATTIQACIRVGGKHNDLDNVGFTARHHTFFEMMGNFSFYDYFKKEAIEYALEFLLKELGIDENKLFFTVHAKDLEAYELFKAKTKQPVILLDSDDNFWSMGEFGPCGYCGEIYYYIGEGHGTEEDFCHSFADKNPKYLEIWNLVFMEFNKKPDGTIETLKRKSIDTGMGLERILSIIEGTYHNYKTSIVAPLVDKAKEIFEVDDSGAYIAADHAKTTLFLLNEGLNIGSEGAPYVLRRIIRRALTYLKKPGFYQMLPAVAQLYEGVYQFPNLNRAIERLKEEEELFFHTIKNGYQRLEISLKNNEVDEIKVFRLHETYGLPPDFALAVLAERGITLDDKIMKSLSDEHKKVSGQMINMDFSSMATQSTCYEKSSDKGIVQLILIDNKVVPESSKEHNECIFITDVSPFYPRGGGQEGDKGFVYGSNFKGEIINTTKKNKTIVHQCKILEGTIHNGLELKMEVDITWRNGTAKHHTGTHLLHAILQEMFGKHIEQKGSFITNNRFRFDYNFSRKLTVEETSYIEDSIKNIIQKGSNVEVIFLDFEVAKEKGAEYLQGTEYDKEVRVINIEPVSFVLCGGIHVKNTRELGSFKIVSDKGCGAGIRRLEVICI